MKRIVCRFHRNLLVSQRLKDTAPVRILFHALFIMLLCIAFFSFPLPPIRAEGTAHFTGDVLDVKGVPVEGAEIFVYDTDEVKRPADFISAKTRKDGRFRMDLPAGTYWVVARLRSGERYGPLKPGDKHSGDPVEIELAPGEVLEQNFIVVDIRETARLKKKTREDYVVIRGRVLDKNKMPVEKMYVIANKDKKCSGIPDYLSAWTDRTGSFTLYVPRGKYFIGYASSFPPGGNCVIKSEEAFNADTTDFVIIIDKSM